MTINNSEKTWLLFMRNWNYLWLNPILNIFNNFLIKLHLTWTINVILLNLSTCKSYSWPSEPIKWELFNKTVFRSNREKLKRSSRVSCVSLHFHGGNVARTARTASAAATLVSHVGLRSKVETRDNSACNSWGCNRWTSPSWRAAALRVAVLEPLSRSTNNRSNLWNIMCQDDYNHCYFPLAFYYLPTRRHF